MTPKEKAKELVAKYLIIFPNSHISLSKQCALIAVEEMLNNTHGDVRKYWLQVKETIQNL